MANTTKLSVEEWDWKRGEGKLKLKSIIEKINQLRDNGVLTSTERHHLNVLQVQVNSIISQYKDRNIISKEVYCNDKAK